MDKKTIDRISREVARQFPEVAGSRPRVTSKAASKSLSQQDAYLLTYRGATGNAGGHAISRTVRVVADESGHILKVTTSR